jgi:exodeoxyribonuclease-3
VGSQPVLDPLAGYQLRLRDAPVVRTVTTVNGIRAAAGKGLVRWLGRTAADVVCLQGTRAQLEEVPPEMLAGWHVSYAPCWSDRAPVNAVYGS